MESRYGIGVNNRYALFLDSDNEDGDNIENIMAKKASLTGDNQKGKALKDSQAKTKDAAPVKKDANNKMANNKDSKPNTREGKFLVSGWVKFQFLKLTWTKALKQELT